LFFQAEINGRINKPLKIGGLWNELKNFVQ